MLRVGLTGGIGSGKSTVARRLAALGAVVHDSDVIARAVVAPGTEGLDAVAARFGAGVIAADGSLDRAALGQVVFADPRARADLEAITHPRIAEHTRALVAQVADDAVVVHDIPLLVELDRGGDYALVCVVGVPADERVRRLVDHRGMDAAEARRRIAAQASDEQRRAVADVWLDNAGSPDALATAVDRLWHDRLVPFERAARAGRPHLPGTTPRLDPDRTRRELARLRGALGDAVPDAGATPGPDADLTLTLADPGRVDDPEVVDALGVRGLLRAGGTPDARLIATADPGRVLRAVVRRA